MFVNVRYSFLGAVLACGAPTLAQVAELEVTLRSPDFEAAYDKTSKSYPLAYFQGQTLLSLDACKSTNPETTASYEWTVVDEAGRTVVQRTTQRSTPPARACDVELTVPAGRSYVASVKASRRSGSPVIQQATVSVPSSVLVVSIGDSFASGEGVPDPPVPI